MATMTSLGPSPGPERDETNEAREASTPHQPRTVIGAATTSDIVRETPRTKKRREWQARKISESRAKQRQNQEAKPAERRTHAATQSDKSEALVAGPYSRTGNAMSARGTPLPKRTVNEGKSKKGSKKCPSCSMPIPPHASGDRQAPSTGQSMASEECTMIRKFPPTRFDATLRPCVHANHPFTNGSGYPDPRPQQQVGQWFSGVTPYTSLDASNYGSGSNHPFVIPNYGVRDSHALGPAQSYHQAWTDNSSLFAPIYNLQPSVGDTRNSQHVRKPVAPSQSSTTQTGDLDWGTSPTIVKTPKKTNWHATSQGLLGIDPLTPSLTDSQKLFEDIGPTSEKLPCAAVMPDHESSNYTPRIRIEGHDWDTSTKVTQSHLQPQSSDEVVLPKEDDIALDDNRLECLRMVQLALRNPEGKPFVSSFRSQSLPSPVSCWESGSTSWMTESTMAVSTEPVDLLSKHNFDNKQELPGFAQGVESFLAPQRDGSW